MAEKPYKAFLNKEILVILSIDNLKIADKKLTEEVRPFGQRAKPYKRKILTEVMMDKFKK